MKGNNGVKFALVIIIIGILTCLTFTGLTINGNRIIKSAGDMRTGIDIRGGVSAKLAPSGLNRQPTKEELNTVVSLINHRLDRKSIFDANVVPDFTNGRVIVDIPWRANETSYEPNTLIKETIVMAKLTFQEVRAANAEELKTDSKVPKFMYMGQNYVKVGEVVLTGDKDVKSATVEADPTNGVQVKLVLQSSGVQKFSDVTAKLAPDTEGGTSKGQIGIFMDEDLVSAPNVSAHISDGTAIISGGFDQASAADLADKINSGNLPFKLEAPQVNVISPTLGQNALDVSVYALITALILVSLFMLIYYRLPGILATIALLGHTVLQLLFISNTGITITLPGIAGIILTIGMGVDANVIIFERVKEELRNGKTLRAAIDIGFKRAFNAVFDANMTTLIASIMLILFGTGSIKSFGITLGLGVVLSFLTAVIASRIMLKSVADLDIAKHHWLYGVKLDKKVVKEAGI